MADGRNRDEVHCGNSLPDGCAERPAIVYLARRPSALVSSSNARALRHFTLCLVKMASDFKISGLSRSFLTLLPLGSATHPWGTADRYLGTDDLPLDVFYRTK